MKHSTLLTLCLFLSCFTAKAQTIANEKMNVVYIGVDNPLSISVFGYKCDEISIKTSDELLKKTNCGKYICKPKKVGTISFYVCAKKNGNEKIIDTITFRAKYIPPPSTGWGYTARRISIRQIRKETELSQAIFDYDYTKSFKVMSFSFLVMKDTNIIATGEIIGSKFNYELLNSLKYVLPGDVILFDKIVAENKEEELIHINSISLRIEI